MQKIGDGLGIFILSIIFSPRPRQSVASLFQLVCVSSYLCVCFTPLFQAWRERYGNQGATGRSRAGYTELKDDSPVTESKKSGRG